MAYGSYTILAASTVPVDCGANGATVTNVSSTTVYYRDESPVSYTQSLYDGSIAPGASAMLTGTSYLHARAGVDAAVVTVQPVAVSSGSGVVSAWAAATNYVAGQPVRYAGKLWTAKAAFTSGAAFDRTKWYLVGESNQNSPLRGLTPMVNRLHPLVASNSSGASGTQDQDWVVGHTVLADGIIESVRFAYIPTASSPEVTTGLTPITFLGSAIQYGGVLYKLKFNGQERFTLEPDGGSIDCDPINLPVAAGQTLYSKGHSTVGATGTGDTNTSTTLTNVVCTSRGGLQVGQTISGTGIPASTTILEIRGNTLILSAAATATATGVALTALGKHGRGVSASTSADGASNGAVTLTNNAYVVGTPAPGAGGSPVFGPVAILGRPTNPKPIVAVIGDSIDYGQGNTAPSEESYITQALTAASIPHVNLSVGGDQMYKWVQQLGGRWRSAIAEGCTSVVIGLQTNDLAVANRTVSQFQGDLLQLATWLKTLGVTKIFTRTDTPRPSASTNAKAYRITINDWKRAGHPIDPTTKAAVAVGTSGAMLSGDPGHPIDALPFECADVWEDSRNSGVWIVANDSGDGVHPSPAGHTAAQAVIAARVGEFV